VFVAGDRTVGEAVAPDARTGVYAPTIVGDGATNYVGCRRNGPKR